jgi:hypothetical protein
MFKIILVPIDIAHPERVESSLAAASKLASAHDSKLGKQVRLILGEVSSRTRSPNGDLVQLIRDGHRWFEDLRSGRAATIAAIAKRDRQQVSHVSRNLSLAFLAPDVTEMILAGRQPITLRLSD